MNEQSGEPQFNVYIAKEHVVGADQLTLLTSVRFLQ